MADRANGSPLDIRISAPGEKCPYRPQAIAAAHPSPLVNPSAAATLVPLTSHLAGIAPAESGRRISQDRSHQKRGPPTILG